MRKILKITQITFLYCLPALLACLVIFHNYAERVQQVGCEIKTFNPSDLACIEAKLSDKGEGACTSEQKRVHGLLTNLHNNCRNDDNAADYGCNLPLKDGSPINLI